MPDALTPPESPPPPKRAAFITWAVCHPASSLFAVAVLSLLVIQPNSIIASPGFIVMLFGAGVYPFVAVLRGFASIFGRKFFALNGVEKLRVVALSLLLVVTSSGVLLFFWGFLGEYYGQLICYGAGCAQGGIMLTSFLPVAWLSYALTRVLCNGFSRFGLWPKAFAPRFP